MNATFGILVNSLFAIPGIRYDGSVTTFGEFLKAAVKSADFEDVKAFARAVGRDQGNMSRITRGERTPPLRDLDAWAKALKLTASEQRTFKMLAGLAHVKDPEIRDLIASELAELRREISELSAEVYRKMR